jgi:hypothetical protein
MNADSLPSPETDSQTPLELDLREYFRSRLPAAFPPLLLSTLEPAPRARRSVLARGRLVLAVCVSLLVLMFGYLLAHNSDSQPRPAPGFNDATGQNKAIFPKAADLATTRTNR